MGQLRFRIASGPDAVRLFVSGEVDMATAPTLLAAVDSAGHADLPWVIVDLGQVPFLDSSGLNALAQARLLLHERGCELVVVNVHPTVQAVIKIAGLENAFNMHSHGAADAHQGPGAPGLSSWVAVPAADRDSGRSPSETERQAELRSPLTSSPDAQFPREQDDAHQASSG